MFIIRLLSQHLSGITMPSSCWFLSLQPTFMMQGHKSLKPAKLHALLLLMITTIEIITQLFTISNRARIGSLLQYQVKNIFFCT